MINPIAALLGANTILDIGILWYVVHASHAQTHRLAEMFRSTLTRFNALDSALDRLNKAIVSSAVHVEEHVDERTLEQRNVLKGLFKEATEASKKLHEYSRLAISEAVKKLQTSSQEYWDFRAEELRVLTEDLTNHARLVMDATAQRSGSGNGRARCPICHRIVHSYITKDDGTIAQCLDCGNRKLICPIS